MQKPVCIITGAGGDICSVVAQQLGENYNIALIGKTKEKLLKTLHTLPNGNHAIYPCDINNTEKIKQVIQNIITEQGNPEVLIHGAAAFGDPKKIERYTDEEVEQIVNTNITSLVTITKSVLPTMTTQGGGSVLTIGSTSYAGPYPKRMLYAMSKRAQQSFTESNAVDYKNEDINFYYIFPGPTEGERVSDIIKKRAISEKKDENKTHRKYEMINGGELLKTKNIAETIAAILNKTLAIPSGSSIGIDNFGIFDESHPLFKTPNTTEHTFIPTKPRNYIQLHADTSKSIQKITKTILIKENLKRMTGKAGKYVVIGSILWAIAQMEGPTQESDKIIAYLQATIENTKSYEYEMKKIAREQYGIHDPSDLIQTSNKLQKHKPIELYVKIAEQARENMKEYENQGYTIHPHSTKESIDI